MTKIERTDLVRDALYTKVNTMYDECAKTTDLNAKQNVIGDLDTIRSGASKGATALQNTNDCVHKIGDEEINGFKTFSATGWITRIKNTSVQKTITPSTWSGSTIAYVDKDDNVMGVVELARETNNNSSFYLSVQDGNGGWHTLGVGTNQAGSGYIIIAEDVRQSLAGQIIKKVSTLPATQQTGVLYVIPE